jgi:hypothetical protein
MNCDLEIIIIEETQKTTKTKENKRNIKARDIYRG